MVPVELFRMAVPVKLFRGPMVPVELLLHGGTGGTFLQTPFPGGAFSREFLAPALLRPQKSSTGTVALVASARAQERPPPAPPNPLLHGGTGGTFLRINGTGGTF